MPFRIKSRKSSPLKRSRKSARKLGRRRSPKRRTRSVKAYRGDVNETTEVSVETTEVSVETTEVSVETTKAHLELYRVFQSPLLRGFKLKFLQLPFRYRFQRGLFLKEGDEDTLEQMYKDYDPYRLVETSEIGKFLLGEFNKVIHDGFVCSPEQIIETKDFTTHKTDDGTFQLTHDLKQLEFTNTERDMLLFHWGKSDPVTNNEVALSCHSNPFWLWNAETLYIFHIPKHSRVIATAK